MSVRRIATVTTRVWLGALLLATIFACGSADTRSSAINSADSGPGTFAPGEAGTATGDACAPNPGNFDVPGNGCDDDGDGMIDNTPSCDNGSLPLDGTALQLANSLGLCQVKQGPTDPHWGIVSATLYRSMISADAPADAQHAILTEFGSVIVPTQGASFAALSSGYADPYDGTSGTTTPFKGIHPPMQGGVVDAAPMGYPKTSAGCPLLDNAVFDLVDLKLEISVPLNALGFQIDFDFWSGEWPEYVCTPYNDTFIALLHSSALGQNDPSNISFDMQGNTVSVNNGFFDRCTPNTETGCAGSVTKMATCPGGPSELAGTGFFDMGTYCGSPSTGGGATGWLTSQAPVTPGETMVIELMIWDTGDPYYDSTVLLDNFRWSAQPVTSGTTRTQ
jgi:hypothetical protein